MIPHKTSLKVKPGLDRLVAFEGIITFEIYDSSNPAKKSKVFEMLVTDSYARLKVGSRR